MKCLHVHVHISVSVLTTEAELLRPIVSFGYIVININCGVLCVVHLLQLGKKPDDGVGCEDFLLWATERFKESRTVASEEALRIYRLQ